jgi:hypothetical protein
MCELGDFEKKHNEKVINDRKKIVLSISSYDCTFEISLKIDADDENEGFTIEVNEMEFKDSQNKVVIENKNLSFKVALILDIIFTMFRERHEFKWNEDDIDWITHFKYLMENSYNIRFKGFFD